MRLSSLLEELPMTTNNLRALDAYDSGFDDGKHEGYDDGYLDAETEYDKKIEELEYQIEELKEQINDAENNAWNTARRIIGCSDDVEDCFDSKLLDETFGDDVIGDNYDNIIIKLPFEEVSKKLQDSVEKYNKDKVLNLKAGDVYEHIGVNQVQLLMFIDKICIYDKTNWALAINEKGLITSINLDDTWMNLRKCKNQDEARVQLVTKLRNLM